MTGGDVLGGLVLAILIFGAGVIVGDASRRFRRKDAPRADVDQAVETANRTSQLLESLLRSEQDDRISSALDRLASSEPEPGAEA